MYIYKGSLLVAPKFVVNRTLLYFEEVSISIEFVYDWCTFVVL